MPDQPNAVSVDTDGTGEAADLLEQENAREAMRSLTRDFGLSQTELAELVGVHRVTVGNWLRGEPVQHPRLAQLACGQLYRVLEGVRSAAIPENAVQVAGAAPRRLLPYGQREREYTTHGAPVPDKLREAQDYLHDLHKLLDRLEGGGTTAALVAAPVGIQGLADTVCAMSAEALGRIRTIFGDEAAPPLTEPKVGIGSSFVPAPATGTMSQD